MKLRKLIAAVLSAALGMSLCGCRKQPEPEPLISEPNTAPVPTAHKTVKTDGALSITRREIGDTPMGADGTWTIFVYMSGSSLESFRGNGTSDMKEMLAASTGENVRFIVETGGTTNWQNDFASEEELGRYLISNGKREKLMGVELDSMAKGSTLRNFLKWGIENYPAENMALVFWGHGDGTVGGVCKDDLFDEEYLSLESINAALSETAALMTDKFEFLGFDNCYMATAEVADIAATYANYMIASEETEPLDGWDYTVLGDLLGKDPHADKETIAKTLCDGFIAGNSEVKDAESITLSVIDLSKLDDFLVKFDAYAGELCGGIADTAALTEFETYLDGAEHFGSKNGFEGYSNSADIGDIIKAGENYSDRTEELLKAIDDMVIYKRNGEEHKNASGLTVYYPFMGRGSAEMTTFAVHCVSPRYLEFIDRKQRITALMPNVQSSAGSLWQEDVNTGTNKLGEYFAETDAPEFTQYENGSYTVSLTPEKLDKLSRVGLSVFRETEGGNLFALGTMPCSDADLKTGVFSGSFDGRWFMLKSREPLQIRLRADGKFVTQLRIEKEEATMLFSFDKGKMTAAIDGIWCKSNNRLFFQKEPVGVTIMTYNDIFNKEGEKERSIKGDEYTIASEPNIVYDKLDDGIYYYKVTAEDIRGNTYETELARFAVENGKPNFDPPEPRTDSD